MESGYDLRRVQLGIDRLARVNTDWSAEDHEAFSTVLAVTRKQFSAIARTVCPRVLAENRSAPFSCRTNPRRRWWSTTTTPKRTMRRAPTRLAENTTGSRHQKQSFNGFSTVCRVMRGELWTLTALFCNRRCSYWAPGDRELCTCSNCGSLGSVNQRTVDGRDLCRACLNYLR